MALPALRATILLTTATAAAGTILYENHEPFRHWADDVGGRAQAAWVGLKEELKEFRDDIEGHRRREAPYGAAEQWEGVGSNPGPFRRRRSHRHHRRRSLGPERVGDEEKAQTAATTSAEPSLHAGTVRKRRTSVHENQMNPADIAVAAMGVDLILGANESAEDSHASGARSRASTETLRSAQEEALHDEAVRTLHPMPMSDDDDESDESAENVLTPVTTRSGGTVDVGMDDGASMSVVSAPSEAGDRVLTPTSGMITPTSSGSADHLIDLEQLRREAAEDARSETVASDEHMEDARSEASGVSEWSRVSDDVVAV